MHCYLLPLVLRVLPTATAQTERQDLEFVSVDQLVLLQAARWSWLRRCW